MKVKQEAELTQLMRSDEQTRRRKEKAAEDAAAEAEQKLKAAQGTSPPPPLNRAQFPRTILRTATLSTSVRGSERVDWSERVGEDHPAVLNGVCNAGRLDHHERAA